MKALFAFLLKPFPWLWYTYSFFYGSGQFHKSHNAPVPYPSIQYRNVHISVLDGRLWDMEQVHSGSIPQAAVKFDPSFVIHHTSDISGMWI